MIFESAWYHENQKTNEPKYVRLYFAIRTEIEKGRIPANYLLPSIREVSRELGISSTTVENAYNQLMVEGYIYSIPQKGYYASKLDSAYFSLSQPVKEINGVSKRTNMNMDYMDTDMFNFREWRKVYTQVLEDCQHRLLLEGDPQGEWELRKALSDYVYRARGIVCDSGQIVIGSGVQTLLSIFCDITQELFQRVAFEEPGFVDVRPVFQKRGFSLHPIGLDKGGIQVDTLYASEAAVCYISPSHQFPTGLVMPVQKRMEVLKWAEQKNGYILEDDYDSELRFSGRPVPSLFSLDNHSHVVYLGSFSTLMAPSMRISYMILPDALIKKYKQYSHHYRATVSSAEQLALSRYIEYGYFERHLRRLRKKCSTRMKAFTAAATHYRQDINIYQTDTGTFVLIEARNQEVYKKLQNNADDMEPVLQQVWDNYFSFQYAGIPEEKYLQLLKMMIQCFCRKGLVDGGDQSQV